MAFKKSS